jgi:hypothetical protein
MPKRPLPPAARSPRHKARLVNTRKIARQATSRVAFERPEPQPDDPLLAFEPYIHKAPRRNSITPDLQRKFIAHLAATGIVARAARHIGRSLEALYKLKQKPGAEGFAEAWDRAAQLGVERLEDSALTRAIEGTERKIRHAGEVVATERVHNEALVMFFLRNRLPERYAREAQVGPGHPLWEKVARALEEERIAKARDPAEIRRVRASLDAKMTQWKRDLLAEWNAKVRAYNAKNGTGLPVVGEDGELEFPDGQ